MSAPTMRILIIGAGGHAGVVLDALRAMGEGPFAFADDNLSLKDRQVRGLPVLGGDGAVLERHPPASVVLANGVGGAASTEARRAVYERFRGRGYQFVTLLHPSAVLAADVVLGAGAQVMAGAVLQTAATVGENSIINTRATVDHDCRIGSHVHVAPGSVLSGNVTVGDGAHLGAGCVVIQGVKIGECALVGAGAVVLRDVPARARVAGNPAKEIGA